MGQLLTFLPGKEAIHTQQVVLSFPRGKEATSPQQLLTFLPVKEAIHPQQIVSPALSFPLGKEAVLPRQLLTFPWVKEADLPRPLLTSPLGKVTVFPRQVNQAIKLGQSGKALGGLPGIGHPRLTRRIALSPGKTTSTLPPPVGFPKGLLMKNLTLSGSLTFPTNLWPQLKGQFWLKGPTLWLPPGNLLT